MTRRFCVLNCEDSKAWTPIDFGQMFIGLLKRDGDEWISVNVARGESVPDISEFDAFVLTGSHYNVRDGTGLPWFDKVCELIRYIAERGYPRLYGGCFGCQIIAHALGGEVGPNLTGRFILKAETIVLQQSFHNLAIKYLLNQPFSKPCLKILVSHGDSVLTLPVGAQLLASSDSCPNEIYVCGSSNNIIGCQSHPEFDFNYCIEERIWPAVVDVRKRLDDDEAIAARNSFKDYGQEDPLYFMELVSSFLHSSDERTNRS
jgi:GMP synthase-like glutamine amidotransferase